MNADSPRPVVPQPAVPQPPAPSHAGEMPGLGDRIRAYGVHVFTASGIVFVFLAVAELTKPVPDVRVAFLYLGIQVLIDAIDGPFARIWRVKEVVPHISGRTIDDLVDYLSYTFVPLLLVSRLDLLPGPDAFWVVPAMLTSLFGFANLEAKDEADGFFLGFPSYWNLVAIYVVAFRPTLGEWPGALLIAACTVLTVLPVRFLYPNLAPRPWKTPVMLGAALWTLAVVVIIFRLPSPPAVLLWASLAYPVAYAFLSVWLDRPRYRRLAAR